jgi:hypothetical protein
MQIPHVIMNAIEAAMLDKQLTPAQYMPTPRRRVFATD